jgi:hypothetical protein
MTHVIIQEKKDGKAVDRMERVADDQYQLIKARMKMWVMLLGER